MVLNMKKLLNLMGAGAIIASSASTTTSCNWFSHSVLDMDISKWKPETMFMKDMDLMQAVVFGKHGIYLNPKDGSTPYVRQDGSSANIQQMWDNNFSDDASTKNHDPDAEEADNDKRDLGLYSFQLEYIAESFIVYYQDNAKKNGDAKIKSLESFRENFDVVYYTGSDPGEETSYSYYYNGKDADENDVDPYVNAQNESKYYKEHTDKVSTDYKQRPKRMTNKWNPGTYQAQNGGYVTSIYLDGAQQGSNEIAHVAFNFDIVIKPSTTKMIKDADGNEVETPVSKDGYYSSDATHNGYWASKAILMITLPLFI
jgi:hypothetical protein